MSRARRKFLIVSFVAVLLPALVSAPLYADPWRVIDSLEQWDQAAGMGQIQPMDPTHWAEYMQHWGVPSYGPPEPNVYREGEPYPENEYANPQLYVYEGNTVDPCYPDDAGLVMAWLSEDPPPEEGNYSSAWEYIFEEDPSLRNCIVKVTITPPSGCNIQNVSFAMQDINGKRRSWQWNTPGAIPYDVPTTVIIDCDKTGVTATKPVASGYASAKAFDITKVMNFDVDENGQYIFGMAPVPPPGAPQFMWMWNYWHNLVVLPKPPAGKYFIKWSQPPEPNDPNTPNLYYGWDEWADYENRPILADDWLCEDERPVTDIHWWGSWMNYWTGEPWSQPYPPPQSVWPIAFHIGIWTDVPAGADPQFDFSHPGKLIWENWCDNWVWNFAGYDVQMLLPADPPPGGEPQLKEACFQFNQLLSQDEWFYQEPNDEYDNDPNKTVYWLSIAPVYLPSQYDDPNFCVWGWKTRPHFFNDDAVRIWDTLDPSGLPVWPPTIAYTWADGDYIWWPDPCDSWDLAFELSTNQPGPEEPDVNAPDPDPLDWESPPTAIGSTAIMMTATTATDPSGGIQYYFDEITGNPGGDDSGWQNSSGYVDLGLDPNTLYIYKVKAKDALGNETGWSPPGAETTAPLCADLYKDVNNIVDGYDFAILADQWLESCP